MLLVWQGRGLVVPAIPFLIFVVLVILEKQILGENPNSTITSIIFLLSFFASAAALFFLGKRFESEGRTVIDKATGKEFVLRRTDTFFFVRVKLWGIILMVLGVLLSGLITTAWIRSTMNPTPAPATVAATP